MSYRKLISEYLIRIPEYYEGQILHWCPACNELHQFAIEKPFSNGAQWTFGDAKGVQDVNKPTFTPSMNIKVGPFPEGSKRAGKFKVCHYNITNGQIKFHDDCTHAMKGMTVPLPVIPEKQRF